ncbi:hypothetical protein [Succinivibrio sp.]|nr:hypothetical protein [uncultured Succinivibrio sp.]
MFENPVRICRLMQQKDVLSPEELLQISYEAGKRKGELLSNCHK